MNQSRSPALGHGVSWLPLAAAVLAAPADARGNPPERLEEIVVTSSLIEMPRRQLGTAVSVLTGEELELRGYHSLVDALRTQPGIGVSNSGGTGKFTALRIRGEEGYRTVLLIDGVKAVDPSGTQAVPTFESLLVTSDVERVEVLRGPQGFIYGADAGGVVSVLTRRGSGAPGGRVTLEAGSLGTRRLDASAAGGNERADFFVSVADLDTDGFNSQVDDTVLRDADGADNRTLHAKLGWNATDALRLQLVARDIDAAAQHDGCFSMATFTTVHDCATTTEQTTYRLSAEHHGERLRSQVGYSLSEVARDNLAEGTSAFATEGELARLEYTGSYAASAAATVVFGLDLQRERMTGDDARERDQRALYAEYQRGFGNRFYLTAGARHDDNDDFGSHTSSRLSGAYVQDLGGSHSLKYRASFGTGFRAPSLYEIGFNLGPFAAPPAAGLALREERSRGYDLGIEYDAPGGLHVDVTYFDQRIENEIFFDLAGSSGYLQTPGSSTSSGVEIVLGVPVGEHWQLLGNWTRNDAASTTNEQRLRRPRQFGNIGFQYVSENAKLRMAANYRFARDSVDVGGIALDDYEVLDVSLAYALGDALELYGRVENATDETYQEIAGYNTAGRAGYAGVRFRF